MRIKSFFKSKKVLSILGIVVAVLLLLVIFFYKSIDLFIKESVIVIKYRNQESFWTVFPTFKENLAFVQANPNNDSAYDSLGQGFYALGGFSDAIKAFKRATEIDPTNDARWFFLAKAYMVKKEYTNARDAYYKAIEFGNSRVTEYKDLAWVYYFRIEPEKDKAYEVLKQGLEKFPNDKDLLFDLTRFYLYDKNKTEFMKYAPLYLKIDPKNELILNNYKEWKP